MKIAVCDDDIQMSNCLEENIILFFTEMDISYTIDKFKSGENFLSSTGIYDIVFMDIYMSGINGIDTIKRCTFNKFKTLVFTTSSKDFAIDAFNVNATHYLIKPIKYLEISTAITRCIDKIKIKPPQVLEVKSKNLITPISLDSIQYVEVLNKVAIIHTESKDIKTYMTLDNIFSQLNEDFMKAQRSFIVNMNFIESFLSNRVILENGLEIPLSRSNKTELKKCYQDFLFRLARRDF